MDFSSLSHKNKTYFNYLSCTFIFSVLKKLITRNTNLFVVTTRWCLRLQISRLVHIWICAPKKRARIANIIHSSRKTLNYSVWLLTIIELHVKNENILADKTNILKKNPKRKPEYFILLSAVRVTYLHMASCHGHPTSIFGKNLVRKTIWDPEFLEHLL